MKFVTQKVECPTHGRFYDPTLGERCHECEDDTIKAVEDALDDLKEEMVWE